MIHGYEDLFVGTVSVAIGVLLITCALANWQWCYSLGTARWLQRYLGRGRTRLLHGVLGLGLLALGVAIASGYRWQLIGP